MSKSGKAEGSGFYYTVVGKAFGQWVYIILRLIWEFALRPGLRYGIGLWVAWQAFNLLKPTTEGHWVFLIEVIVVSGIAGLLSAFIWCRLLNAIKRKIQSIRKEKGWK